MRGWGYPYPYPAAVGDLVGGEVGYTYVSPAGDEAAMVVVLMLVG